MKTQSDAQQLRRSRDVRSQLGGISEVTLWRWVNNDTLDFPQPLKIAGRNFFRADEIDEFIERKANASFDRVAAGYRRERP